MIGWMERRDSKPCYPSAKVTRSAWGTAINIVHRAATGMGVTVKCEAVLEGFDGRFYTFRVSAHDGSEVLGHGTINRAIVSKDKFEEKQRAKLAQNA